MRWALAGSFSATLSTAYCVTSLTSVLPSDSQAQPARTKKATAVAMISFLMSVLLAVHAAVQSSFQPRHLAGQLAQDLVLLTGVGVELLVQLPPAGVGLLLVPP